MKEISNPTKTDHAKKCVICNNDLQGRQKMYCSRQCHNKNGNTKHQNYVCQQARGLKRKIKLIELLGGKCSECNYSKNYAALTFHHKDPTLKSIPLDIRSCSNTNWNTLLKELEKCDLLCIRCHVELHNPQLFV